MERDERSSADDWCSWIGWNTRLVFVFDPGITGRHTRHCRLRLGNLVFHYVLTREIQRRSLIYDEGAIGYTLDNISTNTPYSTFYFGIGALRVTWSKAFRLAFELNFNV